MISAKRTPADLSFTTANFRQNVVDENIAAAQHYRSNGSVKGFKYSCYKHETIKDQLKTIFNKKCAYCDSSVTHIAYGDVDHFRPKSIYWWLGCDWDNLIFSCERCNRTGKNNEFPLLGGGKTKVTPGNPVAFSHEEAKLRLLINPCKDDPEHFFEYDCAVAWIIPKKKLRSNSKKREMAEKSIAIFSLQRTDLVIERQKHLIILNAQIHSAEKAIEDYNKMFRYTEAIKQHFQARMLSEINKLLLFVKPNRQYLGLTKQVVRQFFKDYNLTCPF